MRLTTLAACLCAVGSLFPLAATAEVKQDCVLTGEVMRSADTNNDFLRVRFHQVEQGELADCRLEKRLKRQRFTAEIQNSGIDVPVGAQVVYAYQQTASNTSWRLLQIDTATLLTANTTN